MKLKVTEQLSGTDIYYCNLLGEKTNIKLCRSHIVHYEIHTFTLPQLNLHCNRKSGLWSNQPFRAPTTAKVNKAAFSRFRKITLRGKNERENASFYGLSI